LPLNPYFFTSPDPGSIYTRVFSFLNPSSFLEAAKLTHFFVDKKASAAKETSLDLAHSLDEIKKSCTDIFSHDDTFLSAKAERMGDGLTNACFKLKTGMGTYFLRVPGKGSSEHLSREDEAYNIEVARSLGFNIEIHFLNPKSGMYIGEFLENARPLTPTVLAQKQTMLDVAAVLKTLHTNQMLFKNTIDIFTRLNNLLEKIDSYQHQLIADRSRLNHVLGQLNQICQKDTSKLVACHNDTTPLNFLYHDNRLRLLDWEYSGNNKALFDLANFALISKLPAENELWLLEAYYQHPPSDQLLECFEAYKQLTHLWYYLWAELQIANGSDIVPRDDLIKLAEEHWHAVEQTQIGLKI
jgi:thiamine kinase-like enzyme